MNTKKGYVEDISKGSGSLRHYRYSSGGLRLRTKSSVVEAINLGLRIIRYDKIMKVSEIFDYVTLSFKKQKGDDTNEKLQRTD